MCFEGDLVQADMLDKTARQRRRKFREKTVPTSDRDSHVKDGWEEKTVFKESVGLRKPKELDELLEDELWLLFKNMGFEELNKGRDFRVVVGPVRKQIDVFARESNRVFIAECKARTDGAAIGTKDIRELSDLKGDISVSVAQHYRKQNIRTQTSFLIATRGIRWSKENEELAKKKKITVWKEDELEYYGQLAKLLGSAAKYQIYSILFPGAKMPGTIEVAAIRGGKGKGKYYCFVIQPEKLFQVAYVHHRRSTPQELQGSYQRMLNKVRLDKISDFITKGGDFANNIIINFTKTPTFEQFPQEQQEGDVVFGVLRFPREYASAWVIDGQHRLYAYADNPRRAKSTVPVLAFDGLPVKDQAQLFVDINKEQKAVPANLLWDLYPDIYYDSQEEEHQLLRSISLAVRKLNSDNDSPLRDHVRIPSVTPKSRSGANLTMATVCEALRETGLLDANAKEPQLYKDDYKTTVAFASDRIKAYLDVVADAFPQDWAKGNQGLLRSNIGIRILFTMLREVLLFLRRSGDERVYQKKDLDEFRKQVRRLLRPMFDRLDKIGDAGRNAMRRQTGKGPLMENTRTLAWEIRDEFPGFGMEFLKDWVRKIPSDISDNAIRTLIDDTERKLRTFIAGELEALHGPGWWRKGVPAGVKHAVKESIQKEMRGATPSRREELFGMPPDRRLNFTDTPHLREIVVAGQNWRHFKDFFVDDKEFTSVQFKLFEQIRNKYAHHAEEELEEIKKHQGYWAMRWIRKFRQWEM